MVMTGINTFLQKRELHERNHRFGMVIISYVLSICMLFFGSDSCYNIRSKATGIEHVNAQEKKAVTQLFAQKEYDKLINPYGLREEEFAEKSKRTTDVQIDKGIFPERISTADLTGREQQGTQTKIEHKTEQKTEQKTGQNTDQNTEHVEKEIAAERMAAHYGKVAKTEKGKKEKKQPIKSLSMKIEKNAGFHRATKEEQNMLQRIVEAEASGEDMKGKILVANVILNRVASGKFPNSIEKVIFQKAGGDYQFSPVADKRYWGVKVSKETKEAVMRALQGENNSQGALFFMARKRTSGNSASWFDRRLNRLFRHGGHEFYKNK
jgi:N-acetylmuramoyl-L-alanine amidase